MAETFRRPLIALNGGGPNATPGDEDDPPNQDGSGKDSDKTPPGDGGKEPRAGDAENLDDHPDSHRKGSGSRDSGDPHSGSDGGVDISLEMAAVPR